MKTLANAPHLAVFFLLALCIAGVIILASLGDTIPTQLWYVTLGLLTGGLGIAIPNGSPPPAP